MPQLTTLPASSFSPNKPRHRTPPSSPPSVMSLLGQDTSANMALLATHHAASAPTLRRGQSRATVFHSAKDLAIQSSGALSPGRRPLSRSASSLLPTEPAAAAAAAARALVVPALDESRAAREEMVRALGEQQLLIDRLFRSSEEKALARGLIVHTTKAVKTLLSVTAALEGVARRAQAAHEAEASEASRLRNGLDDKLEEERCGRASDAARADEAAKEAYCTLVAVKAAAAESERGLHAQLASAQEAHAALEVRRKNEADDAVRKADEAERRRIEERRELNYMRRDELAALQASKEKSERALQVTVQGLQVNAPPPPARTALLARSCVHARVLPACVPHLCLRAAALPWSSVQLAQASLPPPHECPWHAPRTQDTLNAESQKAQGFWQQIQTLALSEKATNKLKEQQEEQAKGLAQRLETTERLASREQQKMSAKISRMKQLSDLALGVQSKGAAGAAAGEVPKGTKERNRMLLYDNVRKG